MHISGMSSVSSMCRSFIALHGILLEDSSRILDYFMEVKRVIVRKANEIAQNEHINETC